MMTLAWENRGDVPTARPAEGSLPASRCRYAPDPLCRRQHARCAIAERRGVVKPGSAERGRVGSEVGPFIHTPVAYTDHPILRTDPKIGLLVLTRPEWRGFDFAQA